jgi:hypothetical protein
LHPSISPDLSTDAGQFAMIESVSPKDTKLQFEFIAAIPKTKDVSQYENGIGTLQFDSLRIISFPGSVTKELKSFHLAIDVIGSNLCYVS